MQADLDTDVAARLASALAEPARLRLLAALREGPATVSDLGARLDLPQPRASSHLAVLSAAACVTHERVGRQRVYSATDAALRVLAALDDADDSTPPRRSSQAERELQRDSPLRRARTCYDHLAGVAGVALLDRLLRAGWLQPAAGAKPFFVLTPPGEAALRVRGVDVDAARAMRRAFASACLDWTERRPHLGGALGAQLLRALEIRSIVQRQANTRALAAEPPIDTWLVAAERAVTT